ncbi:MAG: IS110 family transposase [Planctomycetota bacterium]
MFYLGIDQHAKQLTLSLRNASGDVTLSRQVSTEPKRFKDFFSKLQQKAGEDGFIAIVEVCGFNDWLLQALPEYGCRDIVLVQPKKRSKVKTDRRDASALSELLWINRDRIAANQPIRGVRRVILPGKFHAENQRITMIRQQVGRQRTRTINQIKFILRRHNLQWQMPTKTFPTVRAVAWLKTIKLPTWDRAEMDYHIEELGRLTKRMQDLEELITQRARGLEDVELLRTIPGCGYYMALALVSRIGEASRFPRGKSLAHYWGLTPGVRDSGDSKGHRGHITKSGCSMARWLLAQVVFHVLRRDPVMRKWYKPIRNRRGSGIARTAVMRRMAVIIRNMLTEKQSYTECRDAMIDRRKKQTQIKSSAA